MSSARVVSRKNQQATVVVASVVILIAVAIRAFGALSEPFWQDEVASARAIEQPTFPDLIEQVRKTESTPPAWYVVSWALNQAGASPQTLRFLSVALSAVAAGLVVLYARRLLSLWGAGLAGLLAAVGWQFVAHGQELRAYALFALFALLFGFLLDRAARAPTRANLAGLAATAFAGVLTHYLFMLTLLAGTLWLWTSPNRQRGRGPITLANSAGLLALALAAPIFADQYSAERFGWIGDFHPLKALYLYGTFFDHPGGLYAAQPAPFGLREAAWVATSAAVLWGAWRLAKSSEPGRLCAFLTVVPPLAAALIWLSGPDIFNTRNLLGASPFAAIALASAVARGPRPALIAIPTAGLALAATLTAPPREHPADRVANTLIAQGWTADRRTAFLGLNRGFRSSVGWYLPGRPVLEIVHPSTGQSVRFIVTTKRWFDNSTIDGVEKTQQVDGLYVIRLSDDLDLSEVAAADPLITAVARSDTRS